MKSIWIALSSALCAATQLWAQPVARPDPSDSRAVVPPLNYKSSLTGYRVWKEETLGNWKSVNDLVGQIGGWRVYARDAQGKDAAPSSTTPTKTEPAPEPASATTPRPVTR